MLEDEGPVDPDQLGKLTEDDDDDQLDNEDPTGPDQFIADVAPIDETTTEDQEIEELELKRGTLLYICLVSKGYIHKNNKNYKYKNLRETQTDIHHKI